MLRFISTLFGVVLLLALVPAYGQDFQKGRDAYDSGDYATAVREWRPLAEQGHAKAQYNLGNMYRIGQGVAQDYDEAERLWRLAAEPGFADAQSGMAACREPGAAGVHSDGCGGGIVGSVGLKVAGCAPHQSRTSGLTDGRPLWPRHEGRGSLHCHRLQPGHDHRFGEADSRGNVHLGCDVCPPSETISREYIPVTRRSSCKVQRYGRAGPGAVDHYRDAPLPGGWYCRRLGD